MLVNIFVLDLKYVAFCVCMHSTLPWDPTNAFSTLNSEINTIVHEFTAMLIPELHINHISLLFYATKFLWSSIFVSLLKSHESWRSYRKFLLTMSLRSALGQRLSLPVRLEWHLQILVPWMRLRNHFRSWSCSLFEDQTYSKEGFSSLAEVYCSLDLLVLEKRCWQKLLLMKLEQVSSMSQCLPSLQNGLARMKRTSVLCSHLQQRSPQQLFL